MNKLISKNPVQRFKLGNRIIKAAGGIKTFAPVNETIGRYVREKNRSLFGQGWRWYDTTAPVGKSHMALDQEVEENGWILKPDGSKIKASLNDTVNISIKSKKKQVIKMIKDVWVGDNN